MALGSFLAPRFTAFPFPGLSLNFPASPPTPYKQVKPCFQQPWRLEKPYSISVVDTFLIQSPVLKEARLVSHLGMPSPNEAQDLGSGELNVSPTLRWMGTPSLQNRKHMCLEATGLLQGEQ